ncbi:hypothetical protein JTB14_004746 [Gonioctena quinquepunctata]|nr:hypothetical protein JTB14_004746 [Gonioctena quinquepunctata]
MLTQSGLPINLWAEATNMAVYLLNRRPCKPDDSKTPYERWIGKQPDLRHLRTFGSEAFVLVPKHQRQKFDRKSTKQYLVGYDGYSPNYRVYETNSRKVSVFMKQSPVPNYMSFEIDNTFGNENYDCVQINKDECEVSENEVHDQLAPDSDFRNNHSHQHKLRNRDLLQRPQRYDEKCHPNAIPADPNSLLYSEEINIECNAPYREAVGCLMFLAVVSRPDIMFAVSQASLFLSNPKREHWSAVERILRYLKGTQTFGLMYCAEEVNLIAYSDADFAGDLTTRRSTTGYLSIIAGAPVTWLSHLQKCVSRSTTESEYIAASDAAQEISWLRIFLRELGIDILEPTKLFMDNQSAIRLVTNTEYHTRTKHIDVKYHYIRERAEDNTLIVYYVASEDQLADILTKALPKEKFVKNRTSLFIFQNTVYKEGKCYT